MVRPPFKNIKKINRAGVVEDLSYRLPHSSYIIIDSEIINDNSFIYGFSIRNWKFDIPGIKTINILTNYLVSGKKIFYYKIEKYDEYSMIKVTFKNQL